MKTNRILALAMVCIMPAPAGAAELALNPGLWETTMTRTNPMSGDPVTEVSKECVKQKKFDPSSMLEGTEGCRLVDENLTGDRLTFSMECSLQGSRALIDGSFQTDGQTGQGDMDMKVQAGGMNMNMKMNWTAKRIGDC